jgi:hypothetical protein
MISCTNSKQCYSDVGNEWDFRRTLEGDNAAQGLAAEEQGPAFT